MGLMPVDIYNKEFSKSLRGYDVDEVNEFLDQIIKDFEILVRDKKTLKQQVEQMEEKIQRFSSMEETLNKSIVIAQEMSDKVKATSEKEADLLIQEAEKKAEEIVKEAEENVRLAKLEIQNLKKTASMFRDRFKMLIGSQLNMLENEDWDELQNSVNS